MQSSRFALFALAMIGSMSAVEASDLPNRKSAPAPLVVPVLDYNWSGFYAGANAGYGFVRGDVIGVRTQPGNAFLGNFGSVPSKGVFGGLQAGYNWQNGAFVYGLEADAQISGMTASSNAGGFSAKSKNEAFGTLRARLGYAIVDRALVYVTGGLAVTRLKYSFGTATTNLSSTRTNTNWTLGGGLEYAFTDQLGAKVEYLYSQVDARSRSNLGGTFATRSSPSYNLIRVGLNYHFSTTTDPIAVRY